MYTPITLGIETYSSFILLLKKQWHSRYIAPFQFQISMTLQGKGLIFSGNRHLPVLKSLLTSLYHLLYGKYTNYMK